jgi:uncharacterized protein YacL
MLVHQIYTKKEVGDVSLLLSRLVLITLLAIAGYFIQPFAPNPVYGMLAGSLLGLLIIFLESRITRSVEPKTLIGSVLGLVFGIILAIFVSYLIGKLALGKSTTSFLQLFSFFFFIYIGLLLGSKKADWFEPANLAALFGEKGEKKSYKILDTSVIIDGRIADLTETGFLEGTVVVPQFVLRELQHIADSPDSLKRNRGRRGIEILQRMQKKPDLNVTITEIDFPDIPEVDMKLIELAKQLNAKIVTNDYNLNKIAQLQGVRVLNINELASSLRPVVLPGETMKVFILKEGKEYNQGVAYLDDGTMVVVDNARKLIGKNVDVVVTSVLQTTVGKMIFGRHEGE